MFIKGKRIYATRMRDRQFLSSREVSQSNDGKEFECIHSKDCWCAKMTLSDATRAKLSVYNNCLCKECLEALSE